MNKVLLFDVDGVTLKPREKYFSEHLAADYNVPIEKIMPLFKDEFPECLLGKLDLREVLPKYMKEWDLDMTIDELLKYWWNTENTLNTPILEMVASLRTQGTKCFIATDQEKNRANYLWETLGLKNHFDGAFISSQIGTRKSSPEYWVHVLKTLDSPSPDTVFFWDDKEENITVAKNAGVNAFFFHDTDDIQSKLA